MKPYLWREHVVIRESMSGVMDGYFYCHLQEIKSTNLSQNRPLNIMTCMLIRDV